MNPFNITWKDIPFVSSCISQTEPSKLASDKHPKNITTSHTRLQTHEVKHILIIHEFSLHETFNTNVILSPMLHASTTDRFEWYVKIFPNYIHEDIKTIGLYVHLSNNSKVAEAMATTNISIINHKNEALRTVKLAMAKEFQSGTPETNWGWGWTNFCNKDDLFRNHLLQEKDTLTLSINIKWLPEQSCKVVQSIMSSTDPTLETTCIKLNPSENLESMLENPEFADVVFITNGHMYPAHRSILAARSPAFADMIRRKDTKNGKNKKIRIQVTNVDGEVLHAMLKYIYTGKCENFEKLAEKLFVAAVKYGLDGL
ncbi:speckle-type POZ protein-like [Planococcus citri]|uniref:speckle-type POZ protein-like n=1 Tax=Planococcus citri TaxID=170843 RepID=UPI0031F9580B